MSAIRFYSVVRSVGSSGVFTLVASAMGAGCLSLPHMFSKTGVCLGILLLACGALLAHMSLVILMSCARYTESRSFAELVFLSEADTSDGAGASRNSLVDTVIMFYGMAAVLIYMMLIGDFFADIAKSPLFGYSDVSRQHLILASLVCVFPLSIPRNVTALRYISFLSTGVIMFLTVVVVAKVPAQLQHEPPSTNEPLWGEHRPLQTILQSFAMALFSFNAHTNAVPVAMALDQPRAARIWQVSFMSVCIEFVIYSSIATAGYLSFGSATKQDFIRNYPADDGWMLLVRCAYSVPVIFGVPINLSPAAASIQALAGRVFTSRQFARQASDPQPHSLQSRCRRVSIVAFILLCSAALAIWCEAFADVIGLFGACFGTLICLVWPLRIYQRVMKNLHSSWLSGGVVVALTTASILGMVAFLDQCAKALALR